MHHMLVVCTLYLSDEHLISVQCMYISVYYLAVYWGYYCHVTWYNLILDKVLRNGSITFILEAFRVFGAVSIALCSIFYLLRCSRAVQCYSVQCRCAVHCESEPAVFCCILLHWVVSTICSARQCSAVQCTVHMCSALWIRACCRRQWSHYERRSHCSRNIFPHPPFLSSVLFLDAFGDFWG